jgi:hypothetical protein
VTVPFHSARIFLARARGVDVGPCSKAPKVYTIAASQAKFLHKRARQVTAKHAGATRTSARGFWHGGGEPTQLYEVVWRPSPLEKTPAQFHANMKKLASDLGKRFCQQEVLVVLSTPTRRSKHIKRYTA